MLGEKERKKNDRKNKASEVKHNKKNSALKNLRLMLAIRKALL